MAGDKPRKRRAAVDAKSSGSAPASGPADASAKNKQEAPVITDTSKSNDESHHGIGRTESGETFIIPETANSFDATSNPRFWSAARCVCLV
jgi:hypothetical protein